MRILREYQGLFPWLRGEGDRKAKMIHKVSPADCVLSAYKSIHLLQYPLVTFFQHSHFEQHSSQHTSTISSDFPPHTRSHNPAKQTLSFHTTPNITKPPPKTPSPAHPSTFLSATMRWFHKTSSRTPTTTTTSHKQPATSSTASTSYYQTASKSYTHKYPDSYAPYYQNASKSYTHKYPDANAPRRLMWQCCKCGFRDNDENPVKGYRGVECRSTHANKDRPEVVRKCDHLGPCEDCEKKR